MCAAGCVGTSCATTFSGAGDSAGELSHQLGGHIDSISGLLFPGKLAAQGDSAGRPASGGDCCSKIESGCALCFVQGKERQRGDDVSFCPIEGTAAVPDREPARLFLLRKSGG